MNKRLRMSVHGPRNILALRVGTITPKSSEDSFHDFKRTRKWLTSSAPPFLKNEIVFVLLDVSWHPLQIIPLYQWAPRAPSTIFGEPGSDWRHQHRHFWKKRNCIYLVECKSAPSTNNSITPTSSEGSLKKFYDFQRTRKWMTSSAPPFLKKMKFSLSRWM